MTRLDKVLIAIVVTAIGVDALQTYERTRTTACVCASAEVGR